MKIRKLIRDSFYVNNENFSGVTIKSLDDYADGLWCHYRKFSGNWKLTILDIGGHHPVSEDINDHQWTDGFMYNSTLLYNDKVW